MVLRTHEQLSRAGNLPKKVETPRLSRRITSHENMGCLWLPYWQSLKTQRIEMSRMKQALEILQSYRPSETLSCWLLSPSHSKAQATRRQIQVPSQVIKHVHAQLKPLQEVSAPTTTNHPSKSLKCQGMTGNSKSENRRVRLSYLRIGELSGWRMHSKKKNKKYFLQLQIEIHRFMVCHKHHDTSSDCL